MATRVVEGKKPYTWGKAIEIDENKVIYLRLRDENNLIIWDEWDNEIYVDLQLDDEITPTSAFPVWITTGRVIVDNWWDEAWTIICAKTTSGDNIKLLYADSGNLYIDNWTWTFKQIYLKADVDALLLALRSYIDDELAKKQNWVASDTAPNNPSEWDLWYDTVNDQLQVYDGTQWTGIGWWWSSSNTKTFYLVDDQDLTTAQEIVDWVDSWKNAIVIYSNRVYCLIKNDVGIEYIFGEATTPLIPEETVNWESLLTCTGIRILVAQWNVTGIITNFDIGSISFLSTDVNYSTPYTPAYNGSPATKKYVDDSVSWVLKESPNSTITWLKYIRHWTEADYANLSQYYTDTPWDTEFHCF